MASFRRTCNRLTCVLPTEGHEAANDSVSLSDRVRFSANQARGRFFSLHSYERHEKQDFGLSATPSCVYGGGSGYRFFPSRRQRRCTPRGRLSDVDTSNSGDASPHRAVRRRQGQSAPVTTTLAAPRTGVIVSGASITTPRATLAEKKLRCNEPGCEGGLRAVPKTASITNYGVWIWMRKDEAENSAYLPFRAPRSSVWKKHGGRWACCNRRRWRRCWPI